MTETIAYALGGGALIGLAVSIMLVFNGRVTGISGITNSFLTAQEGRLWRGVFIIGLWLGGFVMAMINPAFFTVPETPLPSVLIAGFLVGFGTVMGSGCTSGHGICGLSRLSLRSLVATVTFMLAGILVATGLKHFGGV
ncbi:YeeE/YedE family protein [Bdellovibrio bacteriovorus]|uniref:YeeE/YedE family protein n=1 Tax=Bdellovibrio bacteriovorus TaxID=959 RepID=A0A162FZA7_BDEBC|nr:YeeE/YedE thiosulfate transporter family protein [Bdellovibrio bacteriovorus]KYG62849.1 YeeE/YedE family protein [Bdellovibrio bacteriovorus]